MRQAPLVRMANDIARNLRSIAGADPADAIAAHLRAFWSPGMRAELLKLVEAGGAGLDALAIEAAHRLPRAGPPPTSHATHTSSAPATHD